MFIKSNPYKNIPFPKVGLGISLNVWRIKEVGAGNLGEGSEAFYPLLYAPDMDGDCKATRRVGEGMPYLFSFTFGIPSNKNYPVQK